MGYDAAISQVQQIFEWQQQLTDPTAATTTQGTDSTDATSGTANTSTTDADFAAALADAQAGGDSAATLGSDDATDGVDTTDSGSLDGLLGDGDSQLLSILSTLGSNSSASALTGQSSGGTATATVASAGESEAVSSADPRITAMVDDANSLVGKPYVWGGGHDGWGEQAGYDCSGFVSAVLHAGGYLSSPQDTATLPSAAGLEAGAGNYVTIYDRDAAGEQGHVIIEINGQFYESGGQAGSWGGGGGVEKISTPSAAYLSTFNDVLHPAGL